MALVSTVLGQARHAGTCSPSAEAQLVVVSVGLSGSSDLAQKVTEVDLLAFAVFHGHRLQRRDRGHPYETRTEDARRRRLHNCVDKLCRCAV